MSRFFSARYDRLVPYTPGEQPKILNLTKLNTNECPFPPSDKALAYAAAHTGRKCAGSSRKCTGWGRKTSSSATARTRY